MPIIPLNSPITMPTNEKSEKIAQTEREISLFEFFKRFKTEKDCEKYLSNLGKNRKDTIFGMVNIELRKWFLFVYLRKFSGELQDIVEMCDLDFDVALEMCDLYFAAIQSEEFHSPF